MPNISEKVCWFVNESAHFSSFSRSFPGCTCSIYMVQSCSISGIQSLLQVVIRQRKYDLRRTGVSDERTGKQRDPAFRGSEDSRGVGRGTGKWYFSVVDVVGVLTDSPDYNTGRKYWNKLKQRLKEEGSELVTNCHQLKMRHGCRTGQRTQRRPQIGNESKNSYREILGNCRPRAAYISDFDREMAKYLKGGEPT